MCDQKSKGSFELKFKTEKSYRVFGTEYAKCYANLESKGHMDAPTVSGPLEYQVDFRMECGCETVLGEFKAAYDKTFKSESMVLGVSTDKDYTAVMLACSLPSKADDRRSEFEAASLFFSDNNFSQRTVELASAPGRYADKDGLVEFIVADELIDDPTVMEKLTELKDTLIAVTSIVTSYINRYAEAYGEDFKTDPDLWAKAVSKIPLMGPNTTSQQSYTRHIKGVEIATDFINFIMDVVVSEGSAALGSFEKYLSKQGDAIRFGIEENADFYNTITLGVTSEVMLVGNEIVFVPKIKLYRINFTRENSKFTSLCASAEMVDISFDYIFAASVFDYKALEDPEIKKKFDEFVRAQRKASIEDADTFFNDTFETESSSVPPVPELAKV